MIVVPGFGVTRLFDPVTRHYVWGVPKNTIRTLYPDNLELPVDMSASQTPTDRLIPQGYVGSRGPINIGWQLIEALRKYGGYTPRSLGRAQTGSPVNIFPFYYDWRLSASENASHLDRFIDQVRGESGAKVDLIGHSAGGLIIETYLKLGTSSPSEPDSWREAGLKASSKVDRAILIAAPLRGTIDGFRILNQEERFLRRRFSIDIVATFRSVPELLPWSGRMVLDEDGEVLKENLLEARSWQHLRLGPYDPVVQADAEKRIGKDGIEKLQKAFESNLKSAASWRTALERARPSSVPVTLLAGDCVATARYALIREDHSLAFYPGKLRSNEQRLAEILFEPGDGSIIATSAGGDRKPDALFCDGHQGLATDPNLHRALVRILQE